MSTDIMDIPTRAKRVFIGEEFDLKKWEDVEPFFEDLKNREINSAEDLQQWFLDRSEIESYLSENFAWRYIVALGNNISLRMLVNVTMLFLRYPIYMYEL